MFFSEKDSVGLFAMASVSDCSKSAEKNSMKSSVTFCSGFSARFSFVKIFSFLLIFFLFRSSFAVRLDFFSSARVDAVVSSKVAPVLDADLSEEQLLEFVKYRYLDRAKLAVEVPYGTPVEILYSVSDYGLFLVKLYTSLKLFNYDSFGATFGWIRARDLDLRTGPKLNLAKFVENTIVSAAPSFIWKRKVDGVDRRDFYSMASFFNGAVFESYSSMALRSSGLCVPSLLVNTTDSHRREAVASNALNLVGVPRLEKGSSSAVGGAVDGKYGVDDAGLVSLIYMAAGFSVPREPRDLFLFCSAVPFLQRLLPGDLLFLLVPAERLEEDFDRLCGAPWVGFCEQNLEFLDTVPELFLSVKIDTIAVYVGDGCFVWVDRNFVRKGTLPELLGLNRKNICTGDFIRFGTCDGIVKKYIFFASPFGGASVVGERLMV